MESFPAFSDVLPRLVLLGRSGLFHLNRRLLADAAERLACCDHIYWIIGGACAGKSAVCASLSELTGHMVYDMDEHIYGSYMKSYSPERHPACCSWFHRDDGLSWAMSLRPEDFDSLNRCASAEYIDLFSQSVGETAARTPLLVDGGISHPSVLAEVLPPKRIVCLAVDDSVSREHWENDPGRKFMREAVQGLEGIARPWEKFLLLDRNMNRTMIDESLAAGIPVLHRDQNVPPEELASRCADAFGLPL